MTFLEKQKVKSRLTIVVFAMFGLFIGWISDANALEGFFNTESCSNSTCHENAQAPSCDGCHAHGTHAVTASGVMNITAESDKATYALGETITITLAGGGGRGSWFRALLYDANGDEIDRSSGCATIDLTGQTVCDDASDFAGTTLTMVATETGTHNLTAAWFGNSFDRTGGQFGDNTTSVTTPGWMEDDAINSAIPNSIHGKEIVAVTPFTVNDAAAAPPPPASSGGGGGLSWSVLVGLLLFVVTGMLLRDRQANLLPVKQRKID